MRDGFPQGRDDRGPRHTDEMPAWTEPELRLPAGSSSLAEVEIAALSHRGRVRTNNEDHFCVARFDRSMRTLASNLAEGDVPRHYSETVYGLLVADGVGGAAAGEIASRTAIHALVDPASQADPKFQTPLAFTRLTAKAVHQHLAAHAQGRDRPVPAERTVHSILNRLGYRLRRVRKSKPQKRFPKPTPSSSTCGRSTSTALKTRKRSTFHWIRRPK